MKDTFERIMKPSSMMTHLIDVINSFADQPEDKLADLLLANTDELGMGFEKADAVTLVRLVLTHPGFSEPSEFAKSRPAHRQPSADLKSLLDTGDDNADNDA